MRGLEVYWCLRCNNVEIMEGRIISKRRLCRTYVVVFRLRRGWEINVVKGSLRTVRVTCKFPFLIVLSLLLTPWFARFLVLLIISFSLY